MTNLVKLFYSFKPLIPRSIQIMIRRRVAMIQLKRNRNKWPIYPPAATPPKAWSGWPHGKQFALILMHDVERKRGENKCLQLIQLEEKLGFRSTFNFVPERYHVSPTILQNIRERGFGIGVHGLKHDGKLFSSKEIFMRRSVRINQYLKDWKTFGFTSPAMHHNLNWMTALKIKYATSTFDIDPFEPQPDAAKTIFPFWAPCDESSDRYLEMPYTLPQDFTLFIIMKQENIDIWKKKIDWIAENGGMALLNTHPDYMQFGKSRRKIEEYPVHHYQEFLEYINKTYSKSMWNAMPLDIEKFWSDTFPMVNKN